MTSPCDITPTQHDVVSNGALRFELWVAKQLCVTRVGQSSNLTSASIFVRIVNTGPTPVQLVAADPEALRLVKIWDADRAQSMIELTLGPEPKEIPTVQATIAPGQGWDSSPLENQMSFLVPHLNAGARLDGSSLPEAAKFSRVFGLEAQFAATFNTGAGFVPMDQVLRGSIEAVMLPAAL